MSEISGLEQPILNSPYEPPMRHFAVGRTGPTGEIRPGRRPSDSWIPVPVGKKGKKVDVEQGTLDLSEHTNERREENSLINDIRQRVELWRSRNYNGVTPTSRKLLQHWADPSREERVLFCQREAAETAIYLAEVAGRKGEPDWRERINPENAEHNDGMPRTALKMATGTGKTIVMAMLIAWQTCNKAASPRDARFTNRFLIVTPGITIRDRLRVLHPADDENYYDLRGLVPHDLRPVLEDAAIVITNYHAFLPRTAKELQGVASNTRKLLTAGKKDDPFVESDADIVDRVLRDLKGRGKGEIVVLNDEAHHCYQDKPLGAKEKIAKEDKDRNADARVWFRGLQAITKHNGIKTIYDLSATPFYLGGSGYQEGFIFPWTVSDFSLMDAIESGIVKVPRIPVDDDVADADKPTYLRLWDHVGTKLPKRKGKKAESDATWVPPAELQGALESLYRSYESRFVHWRKELEPFGEPPPVLIVVCPNTIVSKLVYDWIGGQSVELPDGAEVLRKGNLELLSNVVDGQWLAKPPTIVIDSAQLESGEAMKNDFKHAATHEIEVFKHEYRLRNPGADVDKLTDEDLLREVMNTVGKKGKLGEQVRCVVSVSMLTEGWDANTVTHILGIRRFGSQLLCEQVVGRGLRRRSYIPGDDGLFEAEYAEVYGVPFAFIPTDRAVAPPKPPTASTEVYALSERYEYRIVFPKLDGYRVELPEEPVEFDHEHCPSLHIDREKVAIWTEVQGVIGVADQVDLEHIRNARRQQVVFAVAAETLRRYFAGLDDASKPWLFPTLVDVTRRWLDTKVTFAEDTPEGVLLLAQPMARAAEAINEAIVRYPEIRYGKILPRFRWHDASGSSDDVDFLTRRPTMETTKSPVNLVVLDSGWEKEVAELLEADPKVAAYVKNDDLGLEIPYVYQGKSHTYVPDFLVRVVPDGPTDDKVRTLVIEVSGGMKKAQSPGPVAVKAATARNQWCKAVNNHGEFGFWDYVEIDTMFNVRERIAWAIERLYAEELSSELEPVEH